MGINDKVNAHIAQTNQSIDQKIAPIVSKGETIMPETMDIIFELINDKYTISKANTLEDWGTVIGSPKGLAGELEELDELYNLQKSLPELNRLINEVKSKDQKRRKAWEDYAIYLNGPNTDIELPDPFQSTMSRREI
jgi:hypothetical protein